MSPITDKPLMPGPDSVPVDPPDGVQAMVVLDWRDGKVVGLEIWTRPNFSTMTCRGSGTDRLST